MKILELRNTGKVNYAIREQVGQIKYLNQINSINKEKLLRKADNLILGLPNEHLLVQLILRMDIDLNWDFEYLMNYVEARANKVASLMNITSPNNNGKGKYNLLIKDGGYEHLVLLPKQYTDKEYLLNELSDLNTIIPMYNSSTIFSNQLPTYVKDGKLNNDKYSLIGIDVVGLCVLYWRWYNECVGMGRDTGLLVRNYLTTIPLINFTFLQNQLSLFNCVYEVLVNNSHLGKTVFYDEPMFNTIDPSPYLVKLLEWLISVLGSYPLTSVEHLMAQIPNIYDYKKAKFNPDLGWLNNLRQVNWVYQLPVIKAAQLFTVINKKFGYPMNGLDSDIKIWHNVIKGDSGAYVKDSNFKNHYFKQIDRLYDLVT